MFAPPTDETPEEEATAIHAENLRRLMFHRGDSIDPLSIYLHGENLRQHRFRSRRIAVSNELAKVLPRIAAPLVGIWGAQDATAGGSAAIEARRELFHVVQQNAEFHILDGAGHWVMYEAPEWVNAVLE